MQRGGCAPFARLLAYEIQLSRSEVAQLDYVDDYGDAIDDESAVALLAPLEAMYAQAIRLAQITQVSALALLDAPYEEWLRLSIAAKAVTWRRPTKSPHDKYY